MKIISDHLSSGSVVLQGNTFSILSKVEVDIDICTNCSELSNFRS